MLNTVIITEKSTENSSSKTSITSFSHHHHKELSVFQTLTSGQTNMTQGCIAATSLSQPESRNQTASRFVQPFLHSSPHSVFRHGRARPFR